MITFLKESTFVVNDVLSESWTLLKKRYFAIAGLCILMFITYNSSAILGFYFSEINPVLSVLAVLVFVLLYFGIQLTLFKHIFQVLDKDKEQVRLEKSIPSVSEMSFFFGGMVTVFLFTVFSYLVISLVLLPLIYVQIRIDILVTIGVVIAFTFIFLGALRLAFFPFFIIDQGKNTFSALRFSLAITRGNVTKLLILFAFFVMINLMYLYFGYLKLPLVSTGLSLVNSFLVVPLSSIAFAIAYRKMIDDYHGSKDPEVFKNII